MKNKIELTNGTNIWEINEGKWKDDKTKKTKNQKKICQELSKSPKPIYKKDKLTRNKTSGVRQTM